MIFKKRCEGGFMASKYIRYYRIDRVGLPYKDGDLVDLKELIIARAALNQHKPEEITSDPFETLVDPTGSSNKGWVAWNRAFASAVWAITGTIPNKEEINFAREVMRNLSKEFKRNYVDHNFVLCFLPYLTAGFKIHQSDYLHAESNSIKYAKNFVELMYPIGLSKGYSFLCSHRAPQETHPYSLAETINLEKAERALNLILGLLHNSLGKKNVVYYLFQQTVTSKLACSLFPEVVVNYINNHALEKLCSQIESHANQMSTLLKKKSNDICTFVLKPLDDFHEIVNKQLTSVHGNSWRELEPTNWESEYIEIELAKAHTLPQITRLMPYYNEDDKNSLRRKLQNNLTESVIASEQNNSQFSSDLIREIGESFLFSQAQTPMSRALFETEFYASWGEICATENALAIGIDRDADFYQFRSWEVGFLRNNPEAHSHLMYARRSHPESNEKLKYTSFRQFWR